MRTLSINQISLELLYGVLVLQRTSTTATKDMIDGSNETSIFYKVKIKQHKITKEI